MHAEASATADSTARPPEPSPLFVVGIGTSAGGLSALPLLLRSMPPRPGFACVIVMHLSPDHKSELAGLLQQYTPMPVTQVTSTTALEANHVYVIPPNANLDAVDTHLRLSNLERLRAERAPIDHFMRTLAAARDGTAIGVVLTGAGADGSIGLKYISQCGGLTIVQDPREADFDSMPRSAIATGAVDMVLPLRRMSQEIIRFCEIRPQLPVPDDRDRIAQRDDALLRQVLADVERKTRQNFGVYRRASLLKCLRRRMRLQHVTRVEDYIHLLKANKQEAAALADDLLLVPTEFFGDESASRELESIIIPRLLERSADCGRRATRIWSIGCSTGEEAYSAAMLFTEAAESAGRPVNLQIFASDGSAKSLGAAREGVYPREIGATVSSERLERFFTSAGDRFHIKREIRERVLFAAHNLFRDPPFAHLDLIVCRHLLSKLQPEIRRGVLALFHYALQPEGLLLLGDHDEQSIPGFAADSSSRGGLFRKIPGSEVQRDAPPEMQPFASPMPRGATAAGDHHREIGNLYQAALEVYAPPSVLIDAQNEVVHFSNNVARYLRVPGGEPTRDIIRLVPEPARASLVAGLQAMRNGTGSRQSDATMLFTEDGLKRVCLRIERVAATELMLVVFDDRNQPPAAGELRSDAGQIISSLQSEIQSLNLRLQELDRRQLAADLDGTSSLLQEATDELRCVLDQLAASNEELQAVNEELTAVDEENRRRVFELTRISTDLQHLLASTGVATLFLDRELNIVRFTPLLGELFGLRYSDVGRRVSDLTRLANHQDLETDSRQVLSDLKPFDREVMHTDGNWYLSRFLPYRTEAGRVEGVVITLINITARKRAELALQTSNRNKDEFLAVLAHELRNPLAPITSGVEVLKAAPGNRNLVEQMAATMGRQTQQLVRLVDDLLEVSRISGGKLQLRTSIIDLRDVIRDAVAGAAASVKHAGHTLTVDIPDEPLRIVGDATRLVQVASNLINNAVRYTPSPGRIEVRAARQGGEAVLDVADSGVGVPQDLLENIFDMFFQGHPGEGGAAAGLGIGLTLARKLIDLYGGRIAVSSAGQQQGSTFEIHLPLARQIPAPQPAAASESQSPVPAAEQHRILIVDDNTDAAETLRTLLTSLGAKQVHTVASGIQALEAAPELNPDLVLLDLMMPGLDGYEVARRIRAQPWGKDLLLIALSGWGHEEHRRKTREAGFDRHITKPADLATLRALLRTPAATRH